MRLRQLAATQSVVFFAPPEVHQSIADVCKKSTSERLDSNDIVRWLLEQTCSGIEQLQPLHFSQGIDFCRRIQAASDNPLILEDETHRLAYVDALRKAEQQTLKQLYEPKPRLKSATSVVGRMTADIEKYVKELNSRRKAFRDTGSAVHSSALQEVEQEREVAIEVETVREVQKPIHYKPFSFPGLHPDIARFVETGRLAADSTGYQRASSFIGQTALGKKHGIATVTSSKLYVSTEFCRTVRLPTQAPNDDFMVRSD